MIKSLAHLMLGPDSESDPNIMGDDSSDDMGEDGGKSDSDESRLEREAAELLQEFNEIEDRYRQYTRARSDEGENGDTEVEPTVTLHATMLSGETACVEVMNIETVKMIKDQLMTKFKFIPSTSTSTNGSLVVVVLVLVHAYNTYPQIQYNSINIYYA